MVFSKAGPAEILRAAQKDELVTKNIQLLLNDVLLQTGGARWALQYKTVLEAAGYFLYFGNTTLVRLQTLGEEYTGILLVDRSLKALPTFLARLLMLLLDFFGPLVTMKTFSLAEKKIIINEDLRPEAKTQLLELISVLKEVVPFIGHLHKALFYCNWGIYHVAKRLMGINYVLVRYWLKNKESLYGFKVLGIVTLLHLLAYSIHSSFIWVSSKHSSQENEKRVVPSLEHLSMSSSKCSLCLEGMKNISATPCGHLFCWNCIMEWLQEQNKCPLCRESIYPSRIVPLRNFV